MIYMQPNKTKIVLIVIITKIPYNFIYYNIEHTYNILITVLIICKYEYILIYYYLYYKV